MFIGYQCIPPSLADCDKQAARNNYSQHRTIFTTLFVQKCLLSLFQSLKKIEDRPQGYVEAEWQSCQLLARVCLKVAQLQSLVSQTVLEVINNATADKKN